MSWLHCRCCKLLCLLLSPVGQLHADPQLYFQKKSQASLHILMSFTYCYFAFSQFRVWRYFYLCLTPVCPPALWKILCESLTACCRALTFHLFTSINVYSGGYQCFPEVLENLFYWKWKKSKKFLLIFQLHGNSLRANDLSKLTYNL